MSTYTQNLYHIVFGTRGRKPALLAAHRPRLFAYMAGIIENSRCHLYRLNGVEDHVHLLIDLHPGLALAELVKSLKIGSGNWARTSGLFPDFDHWQEGYGAFTRSWEHKDAVVDYIKNQEHHHKKETFVDELRRLVGEAGLPWDERYLP